MSTRRQTPEALLKAAVRDLLRVLHIPHRVTVGGIGMTGWPDIVGTLPPTGRAFFLELKSPTGKATAEQAAFLYEMGQANALCLVARSLEDVVKALEEAGVYVPLQDRLL